MQRLNILAVVLLLGMLRNVPAGVIKGTVTDGLTNTAIESVLVAVKGGGGEAYTDDQGAFTLTTTTDIRDRFSASRAVLPDMNIKLYGIDGVPVVLDQAGGLPDGMYLATDGEQVWNMVVIKGVVRTREISRTAAAKAAAGLTLEFSHKYYTAVELAANEGDTDVAAKMTMWFPDETTTGPTGTLTPSEELTVREEGTLIENLEVNGSIVIKANNITIRNCRFWSLNISTYDSWTGIVVEDSELGWAGVSRYTLRRCKMSSESDDLIRVGGPDIILEDCFLYITGPEKAGSHCDVIQEYPGGSGTGLIVRHNTLWNANPQTSIVIGATDMLFEYNLAAGAGYTLYATEGQRVINNHFSTMFYPAVGRWGVKTGTPGEWTGNVYHETGLPCN